MREHVVYMYGEGIELPSIIINYMYACSCDVRARI